MKKLFGFCFLLLISIPIYSYASINVSGIPLKDSMNKDSLNLTFQNPKVEKALGEIVVLPEGEYDKESASSMIKRVSRIHPNILQALSNSGVKLKLFSGKLTDEPAFSHLRGVQPKGWSKGKTWDDVPGAGGTLIAAAKIGSSDYGEGHGSINLELHEIAHSIENKVFNTLREDPAFLEIWKAEVDKLFPDRAYFCNYPEEYFAEVFAMYYLNEETHNKLKKLAPKTFEFIKKLEEKAIQINIQVHV